MPRPRMSPERGRAHTHTFCGSPRSRNAGQDFTRATFGGNLMKFTGKMSRHVAAQNRAADFVRACAVETHVKILLFCGLVHA
jgi:hypothetical protein